jgi:hypothetical protein
MRVRRKFLTRFSRCRTAAAVMPLLSSTMPRPMRRTRQNTTLYMAVVHAMNTHSTAQNLRAQ